MTPRETIARRITLIKLALSESPRRGEGDDVFQYRIAADIHRLARRILDDCAAMTGAEPRARQGQSMLQTPTSSFSTEPTE